MRHFAYFFLRSYKQSLLIPLGALMTDLKNNLIQVQHTELLNLFGVFLAATLSKMRGCLLMCR